MSESNIKQFSNYFGLRSRSDIGTTNIITVNKWDPLISFKTCSVQNKYFRLSLQFTGAIVFYELNCQRSAVTNVKI